MLIVVSYDLASDHRRYRVARVLEVYGTRVQESVFECHLSLPGRLPALLHPLPQRRGRHPYRGPRRAHPGHRLLPRLKPGKPPAL